MKINEILFVSIDFMALRRLFGLWLVVLQQPEAPPPHVDHVLGHVGGLALAAVRRRRQLGLDP